MRKRRSNLQIVVAVLSACKHPIMKTDLMYKVKITSSKLNGILDQSKKSGIIKLSNQRYCTTNRGLEFLETVQKLLAFNVEI